jgi:hypothetical protein
MDIQQAIAFLIVTVAAAYLGWRLWRQATGKSDGCDGCAGSCGKPVTPSPAVRPAPKATPLVTLGPPPRRPKQE